MIPAHTQKEDPSFTEVIIEEGTYSISVGPPEMLCASNQEAKTKLSVRLRATLNFENTYI